MAVVCAKCCLGDVFIFNADLMVTGIQVNLGKILGTDKLIHEFVYAGQRVPVLDGNFVQGTIIDTKSEGTFFLMDEQYWGAVWRYTGTNETLFKKVCQLLLQLNHFNL